MVDHFNSSDVFFSVGGETFHAHRALLAARSPVFKALLLGSDSTAEACITLNDIEPATFQALLHFMYTDDFPPGAHSSSPDSSDDTEMLHRLLAAAHEYMLDGLKLMCARKLEESLSVETVARTLGYAQMCGCSELKSKCLDFFTAKKNIRAAVTEGYLWLWHNFPSVIQEIKVIWALEDLQI
uniref:BTB domain-containing protein n=1 Tax=Oryza punctata TaxID=4537 RepID=A0A0E0LWV8_ORYPU